MQMMHDMSQHTEFCGHPGMLPDWALTAFSLWFFAGTVFYLYRILFADRVRAVYGYWDIENELGHGICMLAMVTMLAPMLLPVPFALWAWVLGAGAVWFTARALTWGKRVSYPNKWWWDWAHVGMLGGMALMFSGASFPYMVWISGAFWLWFTGYYVYSTIHDLPSRRVLYLGSDLAHMTMGAMMFTMTVWPELFMGHMAM